MIWFYKLVGRLAVPCSDLMEHVEWRMEHGDMPIAETEVGCLRVSTIFLGLDHNYARTGDPLLFETMIFGDGADHYQTWCSTWDEAERMHAAAEVVAASWIARAKAMLGPAFAEPPQSAPSD